MAKLIETFNFGNKENMNVAELIDRLQEMYRDIATAVNKKPDVYQRNTDGSASDTFLSNGDININLSSDKVEMITNHPTFSTVTWTQLS